MYADDDENSGNTGLTMTALSREDREALALGQALIADRLDFKEPSPEIMSVLLTRVLHVLNTAVHRDGVAVEHAVTHRVRCSPALATHKSIQVFERAEDGTYWVSALGILNGIIGLHSTGVGILCAVYDDDGEFMRFGRTPGTEDSQEPYERV